MYHERGIHMDEKMRQQIATFRYNLIAPIVTRMDLSHGEIAPLLREIARGTYQIPGTTRTKVSVRSLARYLALYRQEGFDGLEPAHRTYNQKIPQEYIDKAVALRRENPKRSIERIITMLQTAGEVPEGLLKYSTLYDHLTRLGLTKVGSAGPKTREHYRRFSATRPNELWQGDTHHTLYMPDPEDPSRKRKAYLFAWLDDFSRLCVHGQFYFAERRPSLEDCLKKAIIKCGVPENIYADNGAVFSSLYLERICGHLAIQLIHSRPKKPQGRGKIEKLFQLVENAFASEALLLIRDGKINNIAELNDHFFAWLKHYYHERTHSSTKQKPILRWGSADNQLRTLPLHKLNDACLWEDTRKVDKTGIISIETNTYEVEPDLVGKQVRVRYDPYDLSVPIQVFFEDERFPDAVPAKIRRHHHKDLKTPEETQDRSTEPDACASFSNITLYAAPNCPMP
jgi:putative transposase